MTALLSFLPSHLQLHDNMPTIFREVKYRQELETICCLPPTPKVYLMKF